ncbi:MAG TPA: polysaccharide deacetylase family protein [Isosphaeraceae bacterium]|nr:polysaccharide deacetylase family protein [Isosphaeraceae bacterium]
MKPTNMLRGIPNKREYLARALGGLGVLGVLERATAAWRPGLVVLTYHRIAQPGADRFYDPVISATPESFRAQVEWLRGHVRLLTLTELVAQVESGSPWHEPAALLTFDDGYRDNFDVAVPILRERNIPATFFISTAFLESPRLPWWDHVAYVIKQTQMQRLTLERNPGGGSGVPPLVIDLETTSRTVVIMTIVRAFLDDTIADEQWFLKQLSGRAEVDVDHDGLGRALFMTWDQVRALADSGTALTVGSHAHGHHKLAALADEAQRNELAGSKRILEDRLGREVMALAYPYGWPGTYTARTKVLAAEAGYRLAFTSREGVNRPSTLDPYEVSRLGVGSGDSPALLRARSALFAVFGASFL